MTKILGTSEEVTTCECCGRKGLKKTVALDIDGAVVHYGTDCASKAFRMANAPMSGNTNLNREKLLWLAQTAEQKWLSNWEQLTTLEAR